MTQPYRESALAIPPAPYKHSLLRRLKRVLQRWYILRPWHFLTPFHGSFVVRNPWPCPKCGKRCTAEHVQLLVAHSYLQDAVEHHCCGGSVSDASKGSGFYYPYSRQRLARTQVTMTPVEMERMVRRTEKALSRDSGSYNPYYEDNKWE